jgi:hypothetical protein
MFIFSVMIGWISGDFCFIVTDNKTDITIYPTNHSNSKFFLLCLVGSVVMSVFLCLVVMFFVVAMIGWISGDVGLLCLVVMFFVVAMIGWISGDVCFIVTGGNVYFCCYDWLDKC